MAVRLIDWAFRQPLKPSDRTSTAAAKLVLVALANHAGTDGICWPSAGILADQTTLSTRGVRDALQSLTDQGLIAEVDRRGRTKRVRVWQLRDPDLSPTISTNADGPSIGNADGPSRNADGPSRNADGPAGRSNDEPSGNRQGTVEDPATKSKRRKDGTFRRPSAAGPTPRPGDRLRQLAEGIGRSVP